MTVEAKRRPAGDFTDPEKTYIAFRAKNPIIINPATKLPWTTGDLARVNRTTREVIEEICIQKYKPEAQETIIWGETAQETLQRHSMEYPPEIPQGEPSENEMAFFLGVGLSNFHRQVVEWYGNSYVTISTQSEDENRRKRLKAVFGKWSPHPHESKEETKVYLNPSFQFLLNPEEHVNYDFLDARKRLDPMLFALLLFQSGKSECRISIPNRIAKKHPKALKIIYNAFQRLHPEDKEKIGKLEWRRRDTNNYTIVVNNPDALFSVLVKTQAVRELPFFDEFFPNHKAPAVVSKNGKHPKEEEILSRKP